MADGAGMVEWLTAQIDDDEKAANAATAGPWEVTERSSTYPYREPGEIHTVATFARWVGDKNPEPHPVVTHGDFHEAVSRPDADHIVRHGPDRALREVEAKRKILGRHRCAGTFALAAHPECSGCVYEWPCPDLRDLAEVYSDRPGYREAWRP